MAEANTSPKVDAFLARQQQWQAEFEKLRAIALSTGLEENLKWGQPCYSLAGANVVLMHGFNEYCALLFMKGALLDDPEGILVQQTKNVQSARQIRFTSAAQITRMKRSLKAYIERAIAVEKSGLKVDFKSAEQFEVAEEFQAELDASPGLKDAFEALTPGRRKGYLLYFGGAKLAKTRRERVEKSIPRIMDGLGMDD